ncbi:MAG: Ribonuclease VapC1 [Verrucomicrobia bacterium ADurb.Bin345]|nr:MAG: Ribonuclease VapC1 [Verrucomicrobia bacterium ADurb.Bin345]
MNLVLDTSGLIHFLANQPHATHIVGQAERLYIPAIVLGEWLSGVAPSSRKGQLLAKFLESPRASVLPVDGDTAVFYGHLLQFLRKKGSPVPTNDLWIAACAMQAGAKILTSDAHFLRMPQVLTEFIGR